MKIETLSVDFTDEQKRYLEGFATGLQISKAGRGFGAAGAGKPNAEPSGPDASHIKAQDKVIASGKKLADQEKYKREEHPFDAYPRLKQQALTNAPPSTADNFAGAITACFMSRRRRISYMCRLRIPNGILKHCSCRAWPISPNAIAGRFATSPPAPTFRCGRFRPSICCADRGHSGPRAVFARLRRRQHQKHHGHADGRDRSAGAARYPRICAGVALPHSQDRSLTGLPRKFNVAFDGAGKIAVLEDTNDIAFAAVQVKDGFGVEPASGFALGLGGITGHKDFARETASSSGLRMRPRSPTPSSAFSSISATAPTRLKARLKYVIDGNGHGRIPCRRRGKLGHAFTRLRGSLRAAPGIRPHGACRRAQNKSREVGTGSASPCRSAR